MKVFAVVLAIVAAVAAASSSDSYISAVADNSLPIQEYIPPENNERPIISPDELPTSEYLAPVMEDPAEISGEQSASEEKTTLAQNGYRYKTVRRLKYRQRRDVNEVPASKYLSPTEEAKAVDVAQPVAEEIAGIKSVPEAKTKVAENGYRYKNVRSSKYHNRRDVNEMPGYEYSPSTEMKQPVSKEDTVVETSPEVKTNLAEDGYRYKTVRRLKYRHRRDVNELPASEYLPPTEVAPEEEAASQTMSENIIADISVPEVKTDLAEDGYRYKTVRRLKYRHRRDVNELPANEYLPPTEVEQLVSEEVPVVESNPEVKTDLAEDGYRYKTVRRLKHRQRRDVNELPANEYLPPTEEEQPISGEVPVPAVKTDLAEDGYHYKIVRRLKYRQRRDVSELPANEYLPPNETEQNASEEVSSTKSIPEVETDLANDGYHYKVVRRLKYRSH